MEVVDPIDRFQLFWLFSLSLSVCLAEARV